MPRPALAPTILHAALAALLATTPARADDALGEEGARWFRHVQVLADDGMEGRLTGTAGYERAADYVIGQLFTIGLQPAGTSGYRQPVALVEQSIDVAASHLALATPEGTSPLVIGDDLLLGTRIQQPAAAFSAPLVFLGYGLHLPEAGYDDFAGQDLKGKLVVILNGGPKSISGALRAHASRAELWPALERAGALGLVTIANPRTMDIPWDRQKLFAATPGMRLADPALNPATRPFVTITLNPASAERLFAGSGRSFAEMLAIADRGEALPRFPLPGRIGGQVVATDRALSSPNVVALLPGSDPALKAQMVVLSAHLDHVGIDKPVAGDSIYNGAMDNASGIASMLELARALKASPPRRSVLFLAVTAEERGLLGSWFFARNPSVRGEDIVANINMDMYLPLWPFTHLAALGAEESTLGPVSAAAAASLGVVQLPDPEPERMGFVRSDQYSFVRAGIPALALKFTPSTPEQVAIQRDWLTKRYHAPSDDLAQPLDVRNAAAFNRYLERLVRAVADADRRPQWNRDSFFARFAADRPGAIAP